MRGYPASLQYCFRKSSCRSPLVGATAGTALATGRWQLATALQGGIVRKYLRVLAGVAALCTMSWAQSPAPAPAQTPAQGQTPDQSPPPAPTPEATPIPTAPIPSVAAP